MMTLDEAIIHAEETEREQALKGCFKCAEEHKQLKEWLKELRKLKRCRECPLVREECVLCGIRRKGDKE